MNRKLLAAVLLSVPVLTLLSCGSPGAPEPPSLNLPVPVSNLTATRSGDVVSLAWTMPTHTTDRVPLKHPITTQICRELENSSCAFVATLDLPPGAAGSYTDRLPADLQVSPYRLLRYQILLRNHAGKTAGPSNSAFTAAGPAPAEVTGLTASTSKEGVILRWQPATGAPDVLYAQRQWLSAPESGNNRRSPLATPPAPTQQTLVIRPSAAADPGQALDHSTFPDQKYRYVLRRIVTVDREGQPIEIEGLPSQPFEIATADVFPPSVPQSLVAVADTADKAIDLSWSPDPDSDLAGYRVYRRDLQGDLPAQPIASLGIETSFRDTNAQPGHTYAYSVTAMDGKHNESKPSAEVLETLP
jgi:hypothetical protein